jgi:hypothetical protein
MTSSAIAALIAATVGAVGPCPRYSSAQPIGVPTYWDLEQQYAKDKSLKTSVSAFRRAIPAGTSIIDAEKKLASLDVYCKTKRNAPQIYKCLLAHYQLDDGNEDVIRWTIYLHTADYKVDDIVLDRYLDFKPGY